MRFATSWYSARSLTVAIVLWWGMFAPQPALAGIYLAEVAWMGSPDDANAEWIELFNDGEATDLTGFVLGALDGQPSVLLTGTIGAGATFLLERTDDATVPDVVAGQVYTGGLGNAGEVLELRDASGTLVDRVDGSNGWAIGGSNETKETLQRLGSSGAWVTAAPTPGKVNARVAVTEEEEEAEAVPSGSAWSETAKRSTSGGASATGAATPRKSAPSVVMTPALTVHAGSDRTVPAGVPVRFVATARDERGEDARASCVWSFGDGATGDGAKTTHTYPYEGEYVVVVRASMAAPRGTLAAEDRAVVRVVSLTLTLPHADTRSIEVANDSAHEVDLSRFTLVAGTVYFRIPEGTILLSGARVRFAAGVTKLTPFDPYTVGLFTPSGVLAARYEGVVVTVSEAASLSTDSMATDTALTASAVDTEEYGENTGGMETASVDGSEQNEVSEGMATDVDHPLVAEVDRGLSAAAETSVAPAARTLAEAYGGARETGRSPWWWLAGLAALTGAVGAVVLVVRQERDTPTPLSEAIFTDEEVEEGILVPLEEPASTMPRERRPAGSGRGTHMV